MQSEHPTLAAMPKRPDLKALAKEKGPCLSVFLSNAPRVGNAPSTVNEALQKAEAQLSPLNLARKDRDAFLDPVRELLESEFRNGESVAIFRSPAEFWHFNLPYGVPDSVTLGNTFEVRPLIKALSEEQEFYILALSQKHSRLIYCTLTDSQEVTLPSSIPTSLLAYNQTDPPDHRLENRSHGGQKGKSAPSHPGMMVAFGTGSDADQKDQYLRNFYNALDKELQSFLREKPLPLVVAGVDYEIALYHNVSEYPALVPGGVQGAADGLKRGELHERALDVLETYNETRAGRALTQYEKAAADRIPHSLPEVARAAFDGRILYLFVAEAYRATGRFDEAARKTIEAPNGDDLVAMAMLQTIAHGGEVFELLPEKMPGSHHIAALLRF